MPQMAEQMSNHRFDSATAAAARAKSRETLAARRSLRSKVASGAVSPADAFRLALDDKRTAKMRVRQLVASFPGIGKVTTDEILDKVGVDGARRVSQLGSRQLEAIVDLVEARCRK